jgi:serine/threonine protein kinase
MSSDHASACPFGCVAARSGPRVRDRQPPGDETRRARCADVWACGVLLFVMLLGAFPFEHSTASAADEQRAFNEVHFEQIRIHWTENERNKDIVKRMSHECMDLLDQIFQLDEKKRIKIVDIKKHPWYTEPLSATYAAAMKRLTAEQAELDQRLQLTQVRPNCDVCRLAMKLWLQRRVAHPWANVSTSACDVSLDTLTHPHHA